MSARTCIHCGVSEALAQLLKDSTCIDSTACELRSAEAENARLKIEIAKLQAEGDRLRELLRSASNHIERTREAAQRVEDVIAHALKYKPEATR